MNRLWSGLLLAVYCCVAPQGVLAQSANIELQAITDFTNFDSGEVPYYLDIAGDRNVLAINAADPNYRNKFARAEHEFTGADGIYDITINALGEVDGDGTYRLLINGVVQGVSVNMPVTTDYTIIEHTFQGIALTAPDVIGVESNAVSNDKIPEGDGFAFARGRWRSVTLSEHDAGTANADMSADLGMTLSTVDALTTDGGQAPFIVTVVNNSTMSTATKPVVVFVLTDEITFNSSDTCTRSTAAVTCTLPNLAPGEVYTVSFTGEIHTEGWLSISASVGADQADNDRANNTATLSFEAAAQGPVATAPPAEPPPPTVPPVANSTTNTQGNTGGTAGGSDAIDSPTEPSIVNSISPTTNNASANSADGDSGATGVAGIILLLLFSVFRVRQAGKPA